jgi:hypothetical protein
MKYLSFFAAGLFFCATLSAENPAPFFNWSLLASGSLEEVSPSGGTLHNRGEFKLNFLPAGLTLRGEILDRRKLNFSPDLPLSDPNKQVTNFLGALYHKPTGSRLLYGALDEWGLSARIRNPWIRSPPYAENHKPLIADLKTAASSTKNDEAYLYLSSPQISIFPNVKMRGFVTAQTEIEEFKGSLAGGVDFTLPNKTGVLLETFYTTATLPETKNNSWFTYPPPLPERDFKLYAAGLLFHNQFISAGGDLAVSETFAWGTDIYGNIGISLTPLLPFTDRKRPLLISFAADGAGERFTFRDGAAHGAGFRGAGKIEWKGRRTSLLRLNTVLRSQGIGEYFYRSSTGFYYRFPAKKRFDDSVFRFTRISFTADRNSEKLQKISDKFTGHLGISLNLQKLKIKSPLGVNFSGSIAALTAAESIPSPYPVPENSWNYNSAGINCEFVWSPLFLQFKSRLGYTNEVEKEAENEEKWDFSVSSTARFKNGRLSLKAASPDFPEKWNFTISWRLEIK